MKILQINAVYRKGSTGRTCKELSDYINGTEDSCYTVYAYGSTDDKNTHRMSSSLDIRFHGFMSRLSGKQGYFSVASTKRLISYIDKLKPDVVQLRNMHGNYISYPILLKYLADKDIPTVLTLHDCWFYTGKCCHYTVDGCYRWKDGCYKCPRLKKDNKSWFIDATPSMWRKKKELFEKIPRLAVVGVSDWITSEAQKSYLSCAAILRRIYNWIDIDVFYPRNEAVAVRERMGLKNKKVILGVSSFWDDSKGLGDFIRLSELLSDEYVILLIGKLSPEVELSKNVKHIPVTDSVNELAQYYSMADVFVTLSREESFGKVSAEALACGTPIICYDSTANPELVGDGCGRVVDVGDIQAVSSAIKDLCNKDKSEISVVCRAYAEENFNKNDRIKDYISLYRELCSM
ncbi:MAG: glycosyltransferase [Clostridia bacterium]|nr:glycosyltransferase [Clostridia bacterium]